MESEAPPGVRRYLATMGILFLAGVVIVMVRTIFGPGYIAGGSVAFLVTAAYARGLFDGRKGVEW